MAFAPVFQRPFSATFSRAAAAAAAPAWYVVAGKTCVAAYQPKDAASLAASYVNLANPGTYDAAPGVAPTWASATGWTFNGINQYLTTGVVPASNQTWSALVRFSNGINANSSCLMGCGSPYWMLWDAANIGSWGAWYWNAGGVLHNPPQILFGVLGFAGNTAYRNGVAELGSLTAPSGTITRDVWVGGWNNGTLVNATNRSIQAVAIYSATLTAGEVAAVSAAMAAL